VLQFDYLSLNDYCQGFVGGDISKLITKTYTYTLNIYSQQQLEMKNIIVKYEHFIETLKT
jgi:hypothetical protein